jgi:hypothetical protein
VLGHEGINATRGRPAGSIDSSKLSNDKMLTAQQQIVSACHPGDASP